MQGRNNQNRVFHPGIDKVCSRDTFIVLDGIGERCSLVQRLDKAPQGFRKKCPGVKRFTELTLLQRAARPSLQCCWPSKTFCCFLEAEGNTPSSSLEPLSKMLLDSYPEES